MLHQLVKWTLITIALAIGLAGGLYVTVIAADHFRGLTKGAAVFGILALCVGLARGANWLAHKIAPLADDRTNG